jgi:hypothetical protein
MENWANRTMRAAGGLSVLALSRRRHDSSAGLAIYSLADPQPRRHRLSTLDPSDTHDSVASC